MLHKVSSLNTINDGISTKCTSGQKICTKHSVFIIYELFYLLEKYYLKKNISIFKTSQIISYRKTSKIQKFCIFDQFSDTLCWATKLIFKRHS